MEDKEREFLDDTSLSKTPNSPQKTSTAVKEIRKWSRETQNACAFNSFCTLDPSLPPDQTLNGSNHFPVLQKYLFRQFSDKDTECANSSLGILSIDNMSGLNESAEHLPNQRIKKKEKFVLKKQDVLIEDDFKQKDFPENHEFVANCNGYKSSISKEKNSRSSSDSSDIEYDGSNIPELNSDFEENIIEINNKNDFQASKLGQLKETLLCEKNKTQSIENAVGTKNKRQDSLCKRQTNSSLKNSFAFENYSPEYSSIYKKLCEPMRTSTKDVVKENSTFSKDNPFLNDSSFHFDSVYGKADITGSDSVISEAVDVERGPRFSDIVFSPDEISARSSSSPGSSLKDISRAKTPGIESVAPVKLDNDLINEEILAGSEKIKDTVTTPICKLAFDVDSHVEINDETHVQRKTNDHEQNSFQNETASFQNTSNNISKVFAGEKNNFSLNFSEDEFLSAGAAYKLLNQCEESFQKANMFRIGSEGSNPENKRFSSWSMPHANEITLPSCYSQLYNSRHGSIGQFIQAKTEALGSLSEDSNRERPFFGTIVQTPPRPSRSRDSRSQSLSELSESTDNETSTTINETSTTIDESIDQTLSQSLVTRMLNELTSDDPLKLASQFLGKHFTDKKKFINTPTETSRTLSPVSSVSSQSSNAQCCPQMPSSVDTLKEQAFQVRFPSVNTSSSTTDVPALYSRPCSSCSTYQDANANNMMALAASLPMQQAIQRTIQGTLPLYMSGLRPPSLSIQGPSEIHYPEVICVKDTQSVTLEVFSGIPCIFHLSLLYASINGTSLPIQSSGVLIPKMVSSNGTFTSIEIKLSPQYEGRTEVELHTIPTASPMEQIYTSTIGQPQLEKLVTRIIFEAEYPQIVLKSNGKAKLDLGVVIAGSTIMSSISLINKGKSSVPLRIIISNDIPDLTFAMQEMNLHESSECGKWRFISPKVMLYRLPPYTRSKHVENNIPILFESGEKSSGQMNGVITASLEHPIASEMLASISFFSSVSAANIVLKDESQKILMMTAKETENSMQKVVIISSSSMSFTVDLAMSAGNEHFTINPATLHLLPSQENEVTIVFHPSASQCPVIKSFLQAAAQPHGKLFTIAEVIGNIQQSAPQVRSHPLNETVYRANEEASVLLECNKCYMEFGGVNVGETLTKQVRIRNPVNKVLKVEALVKDRARCFKLAECSNTGRETQLITLNPREEKSLSITYSPMSVQSSSGILYMKAANSSNQQSSSLQLSGYGGLSKVKLIGMQSREGLGWLLHVNVPSTKGNVCHNIKVHNVGCRAAFVSLLFVPEAYSQQALRVFINPSEFVLLENESKTLLVTCNFSDTACLSLDLHMGTIAMYSGDEIMRQKSKRVSVNSSNNQALGEPLKNVNFHVPFCGENRVAHESFYSSSQMDCKLFYRHLNHQQIILCQGLEDVSFIGSNFMNLPVTHETFDNCTFDATLGSRHSLASGEEPVKDSPKFSRFSMLTLSNKDLTAAPILWTVEPQELVLDVENKDARLLLSNNSKTCLRFKLEWNANTISVSPVQGTVPANGHIGLRVKLIRLLLQREDSSIKVICNNIEKVVRVAVYSYSLRALQSTIADETLKSMFMDDSHLIQSYADAAQTIDVCAFPHKINLQHSVVGICSDTTLTIQNSNSNTIKWAFQILQVESQSACGDNSSLSVPVITILPSTGVLQPQESTSIAIKFLPVCAGFLRRRYNVVTEDADGSNHKQEVEIEGLALTNTLSSYALDCGDNSSRERGKVFVDTDLLEFPVTAPGKKAKLKLTIKNTTRQNHKLTVMKPPFPFVMKPLSIDVKSCKYLTLPVYFQPSKPRALYESSMCLESDAGHKFLVNLKGSCELEK